MLHSVFGVKLRFDNRNVDVYVFWLEGIAINTSSDIGSCLGSHGVNSAHIIRFEVQRRFRAFLHRIRFTTLD